MNKSELLNKLQAKHHHWESLLNEIGPDRLEQPGANGDWTMKDVVAHLTGWQARLVANVQAAARGQSEPPPPWPASLQSEDEINAWIYETNHNRPARQVLHDSEQLYQRLFSFLETLPDDTRFDPVFYNDQEFLLVWFGDERFPIAEFFDHFRDDHEPNIRAWLSHPTPP